VKKATKQTSYGNNTNMTPFPVGTKIRIKGGTEEWQVVGYKNGFLMQMKPVNEAAMWGMDSLAHHVIETHKKMSKTPMYSPNRTVQQPCMYADMYDVVPGELK